MSSIFENRIYKQGDDVKGRDVQEGRGEETGLDRRERKRKEVINKLSNHNFKNQKITLVILTLEHGLLAAQVLKKPFIP